MKELSFSVLLENNLAGDLNNDDELNILDVVIMVGVILQDEFDSSADFNNDSLVNILDIVQLVNLILM